MSALPPQIPKDKADPHKMSQAANLQHATQKVNRFAKRDPALYPLSFIVAGGLCAAGYFFMTKTTSGEVHTKLMADGVVNPWDNTNKHDTHPSQVASFKYRHQTREGHMEDSLPTLNEDVRALKTAAAHKYHTNK